MIRNLQVVYSNCYTSSNLRRLLLVAVMLAMVEARGKKKRTGTGASCTMDCSATCCLDTECATDLADCAGYKNRDFSELYYGVLTIIALVIGIPAFISFLNCCLMYRFC